MNPYENIQIGNFLINFGYYLHEIKANSSLPVSINLLQQTPLDPRMSDIFGAMDKQFFIIEFKRDKKSIETEREKPKYNKLVKELESPKDKVFQLDTANKCHLLSYGVTIEDNQFDYEFIPYINLNETSIIFDSMKSFIAALFNSEIGIEYESFKEYIGLLNKISGNQSNSSDSGTLDKNVENMHGLVVCLDAENKLKQCIFSSLTQLNMMLGIDNGITNQNQSSNNRKSSKNINLGRNL